MGQPDQFAKRTFEEETATLTHGVVTWEDPPETSLTHIQGDGRFLVRRSRRLLHLDPPWSYVRGHDEIGVEIIMAGNRVGLAAIERILLRRQARQVERVEDPDAPFSGQGPMWTVAPIVSPVLRVVWKVRRVARGCYWVQSVVFPFLWIAANELPLLTITAERRWMTSCGDHRRPRRAMTRLMAALRAAITRVRGARRRAGGIAGRSAWYAPCGDEPVAQRSPGAATPADAVWRSLARA